MLFSVLFHCKVLAGQTGYIKMSSWAVGKCDMAFFIILWSLNSGPTGDNEGNMFDLVSMHTLLCFCFFAV